MKDYSITIEDDPSFDDIRFLMRKLHEYNVSQTGLEGELLSLFLRDAEHGRWADAASHAAPGRTEVVSGCDITPAVGWA